MAVSLKAPKAAPKAAPNAAQEVWDRMPWWQKALVGYGKGASDVVRKDIAQPAANFNEFAQPPSLPFGPSIAPTYIRPPHGTAKRFAHQTEELNRPFESLKGQAPDILAGIGSTATLLPAAMLTDGAVDAALPAGGGMGLMGALRRAAPVSAGGAALGAMEPEDRAGNALIGAMLPPAAQLAGKAATAAGFPLMRAMHHSGALSSGALYNLLVGVPGLASAARAATNRLPAIFRHAASVGRDVVQDKATTPIKRHLNRVFLEGGPQTEGGEAPQR